MRSGSGGNAARLAVRALAARALAVRTWPAGGLRLAGALLALTLVAIGLIGGCAAEPSAEPTVRSFLLAWEQGRYWDAASYTTGGQRTVAAALQSEYQQLGAAALYLSMGPITLHGSWAAARFSASVDLGQDGAPWTYQGWFTLSRAGTDWKIDWSPSVINPSLRAGQRLAVITQVPARALVLDSAGRPLLTPSAADVLGVRPDRLANPAEVAAKFAAATGLAADQVLSQILIAPPGRFQELLTLSPHAYARLRHRLSRIKGVQVRQVQERLFTSVTPEIVGTIDTENAALARQQGMPYLPGTTIGRSGLEQAYQHRLAGSPLTEVVVESTRGTVISVLKRWQGQSPVPVRTTIDAGLQSAASRAISASGVAAAIVVVQVQTGRILAVAHGPSYGQPLRAGDALNGRYPPGEAFTIVSTAALLGGGLSVGAQIPCAAAQNVGGETFTNDQQGTGAGAQPPFRVDFAHECATAFAGLSRLLTPDQLVTTAARFGLGVRWQLPLPAFSGSVPVPGNDAQLAADTIGEGSVLVSPLAMALVAAEVKSGTWHPPVLVTDPPDPSAVPLTPLAPQLMSTLRSLMRGTVASGAGHVASVRGQPVYGQVGAAPMTPRQGRTWAYWFVGFRGNVAFAVLVLGRQGGPGAAPVAATFLRLAARG